MRTFLSITCAVAMIASVVLAVIFIPVPLLWISGALFAAGIVILIWDSIKGAIKNRSQGRCS